MLTVSKGCLSTKTVQNKGRSEKTLTFRVNTLELPFLCLDLLRVCYTPIQHVPAVLATYKKSSTTIFDTLKLQLGIY